MTVGTNSNYPNYSSTNSNQFDVCNAPATFERLTDSPLGRFQWTTCLCYLDDVVFCFPTFETYVQRLSGILGVIRRSGLQLHSKKCHFGCRQVKILGHRIYATGVQPDPEKINAFKDFPVCTLVELCSYFHRFVKYFFAIARPLTDRNKYAAFF